MRHAHHVLTIRGVAETLGVSRERVKQLLAAGWIRVFAVTASGARLFRQEDVERLHAERERVRDVRSAAGRDADGESPPLHRAAPTK